MFLLLGQGWTLIKDVAGEIGKWFTSTFTVKNLTAAIGTVKTVFQNLAATLFGWIVEGFGLIKDVGSQIIGAITSAWSGTKNKTVILSGAQIDLSGGSITKLPPNFTPPGTKQQSYRPVYFDSQNEQASLGRAPQTREELYALLDAYGIHGSTGPNTGLPLATAKTIPISETIRGSQGQSLGTTKTLASPNDIMARQIVQITKDLNVFAKVIVQVTKDISVYAKSIMTTVSDHNVFAKTIVTIIKDINVYAKTLVTLTKDISVYAKAVVTTTKDHNTFAKTIVTITKDNNTYAKTIVQVTKDLNQEARAIVQVTKDLKQQESQARKTASAIRSIPSGGFSGGGFNFAKGGIISAANGIMTTQGPTILVGDNPGGRETVAAIPHNNPYPTVSKIDRMFGSGGSSDGSTVNQTIQLHISGNDIINERNLEKRIKLTVGENRDRFG